MISVSDKTGVVEFAKGLRALGWEVIATGGTMKLLRESGVEVLNKDLRAGDRVRVIKGPLAGLEGELIRVRGHKRVVIRIDGVASIATSYIPGSHLERINKGQDKEA